jgi:hypothetical protein
MAYIEWVDLAVEVGEIEDEEAEVPEAEE